MLAIDTDIKNHEIAIDGLRQDGLSLRSDFEAVCASLPFGTPEVAAKLKAPKAEGSELKVGLKLVLKRCIAKHANSSAKDVALYMAEAAQKYVDGRHAEIPSWVADWSKQLIDKAYPQPQVETPASEVTDTKQIPPESAGIVKRKRKK